MLCQCSLLSLPISSPAAELRQQALWCADNNNNNGGGGGGVDDNNNNNNNGGGGADNNNNNNNNNGGPANNNNNNNNNNGKPRSALCYLTGWNRRLRLRVCLAPLLPVICARPACCRALAVAPAAE